MRKDAKPLVEWRYADHTWCEINDEVPKNKVVILPVGSTEDHGPHLPLDTDCILPTSVAEAAAEKRPDLLLIMPTIPYGFNLHHMDYPGVIHVAQQHFIDYVLDVVKSLAYHGFKKILLLNGHGSNMPLLDLVARRAILETDALCALTIWVNFGLKRFHELRETPFPGVAHAEELETSAYLFWAPDRVRKDKIVSEFPEVYKNDFVWQDLEHGSPVYLTDWWSRFGTTGVIGDPHKASAEKGRIVVEEVIDNLIKFSEWFRDQKIEERRDFHTHGHGEAKLDS